MTVIRLVSRFMFFLALFLASAGCDSGNGGGGGGGGGMVGGTPPCGYTFGANPSTFASSGGSGTGTVGAAPTSSTCNWLATSNQTWLTIPNPSGSGAGQFTYNAAANTTTNPLNGTITLSWTGGSVNQTITVNPPPVSTVVEPKFQVRKTTSTNPGLCEVINAVPSVLNAEVVIKCEFDASSSVNAHLITSYKFTVDFSASAQRTLGLAQIVTDPTTTCGFPASTSTPLTVTLTVTTTSGETKTVSQTVSFSKNASC